MFVREWVVVQLMWIQSPEKWHILRSSHVDELQYSYGLQGPKPLLLTESTTEELCCLLAGSAATLEEKSSIEFGAHQAIIVRNQKAKEDLPDEFRGALCLTTNEAKG